MQPLTAGQVLAGRFRLVRPLGEGASGTVWLAERVGETGTVALKIATHQAQDESLRQQFERSRTLAHPGILPVTEYVDGPPALLVMNCLEGGSIGGLRGGGFRTVLQAMSSVAEALDYAHRQGVVHRDLKASNVLRDARGRCFVCDFAPAQGSLPGMSPQQLDGEPPAVSDDVYGFGALLYDLLAGEPLFHPQVSPDSIRAQPPRLPVADLTGEPLPQPLRQLLSGLLKKRAEERPPGMAAVRSALEEILRDHPDAAAAAGVIRPATRTPGAPPGPAPQRRARQALPAPVVYGGLVVLALLAVVVVFYLPAVVRERGPLLKPAAVPQVRAPTASAAAPVAPAVPQATLDEALGEFLRSDEQLRALNADKWGGTAWAELRRLAQSADEAYRSRDSAAALARYHQAGAQARALIERAPGVRTEALRAGEAALVAADKTQAVAQFQVALWIAPDDFAARRGLARAQQLDQVLELMQKAAAAEASGQREAALGLYRQAARLDPAWTPATAAIARLTQAVASDAFQVEMARGLAAQAGGDLANARAAFTAALRARPGDAAATAALAQVDSDQELARLTALQAEARAFAQQERWADAVQRYEAVLAANANLVEARAGAEDARERAKLDARLRAEIANADRFNDDAVFGKAQALLAAARAVPDAGPVLRGQVAELERLLAIAATPVRVVLESDNATQVTLFKVGRLGVFASRTLELRPGTYTAVGSRPGYRDVRRNFRVAPGAEATPVVVRCEEPI